MQLNANKRQYYVGWDVGAWNCENNSRSRDAIVILDSDKDIIGLPWRGNLRKTINDSKNTQEWLINIFALCGLNIDLPRSQVTIAIDTPLGFSDSLRNLLAGNPVLDEIEYSASNPYLFRATEQFLFSVGLKPLSSIKDMIGSQATKGIHTLARFCDINDTCGVWKHANLLTAIEAYPSACKKSHVIDKLLNQYIDLEWFDESEGQVRFKYSVGIEHDDHKDALICALVAWLFDRSPSSLVFPPDDVSLKEGWIFVPADGLDYGYAQLISDN
ncbi:MAG: hypothetical protein ACSHWT_00360 [Glaciecola sp.]